jgi:hypothetical protein
MPNHVTNKLIIVGVEPERLKAIRLAIASTLVENKADEIEAIDFNKIIPMPPSLSVESSSIGDMGLAHLHPEYAKYEFEKGEEGKKRWKELDRKRKTEALKLGRIYYDNIVQYGHKDWYSWCVASWGTKWGAYAIYVQDKQDENGAITEYSNEIQFDTAWATPYRVIRKLSFMFPDAEFSVTYADEDMGQNCGRYTFQNGEEIDVYQPDGGSDEAMELAIEVKNMQGELVKNESTGEWQYLSEIEAEKNAEQDDHTAEIENSEEAKANEG